MEFNRFLELVPKIANIALPGERAHFKMAPPERQKIMESFDISTANPRKAAVTMLVYPSASQATLALIRRNSYKGVHSSQIAFPGGKVESYDESDLATALRETNEEIGIAPGTIELVRPFSPVYIPPSNFFVAPFLGYCNHHPQFIPDPREVASMVELPLRVLLDESSIVLKQMATSYSESIAVPSILIGDDTIWGATAMMLSELKDVLAAVQ
ncbi:MAG: CoA pyrophosphatase [Flavobacterium sp.]|nr:MAG: CoA pyrophosphatase [Flavobacterium sp.]